MTSEPLAELGPDSLVGAYRIAREIGRGGMATVYEAAHAVLPRRAALKVMHAALLRQPGMTTRMVQEASILENVRHPGVVRVYECNLLPDHRPWFAMELVDGETLADRLHYATVLPALEVASLIADIADVLATVHRSGVVHRDLKPDNLLSTPTDRDYPLRVLDWGVARLGPIGRLTLDDLTPGTPIYMSPEQATGRNIAAPCDMYSLGVIAYEALTGEPPFDGCTLAEVVCMHLTRAPKPLRKHCNAPYALCDLVERMLEKDPSLRPTAVEARHLARVIAADLSPAYEAFEVSVGEPPESPPATRCRIARASIGGPDRLPAVDEVLENGVTEMLPVVPKPRWTPEIGRVPAGLTICHGRRAVAPRALRDPIPGEIFAANKAR
ncbi:MAG TPA: serine/threonine-protein kinase [Kofleriaceae bacterium]|nr:serine/threonine-protein kinase [Kofleriaceae bacterium]